MSSAGSEGDLTPSEMLAIRGFETHDALDAAIQAAPTWNEDKARNLIRTLLLPSCSLGRDSHHLQTMVAVARSGDPEIRTLQNGPLFKSEYTRRLLNYVKNAPIAHAEDDDDLDGYSDAVSTPEIPPPPPWEGLTWILDLLPHWPAQALGVLDSYVLAHAQILPDGRLSALSDAASVIRAHYIGNATSVGDRLDLLFSMNPRLFEGLISALYQSLGFDVEATPPGGDGGRDVIARRTDATRRSELQIQCKRWRKKVGVEKVRELSWVVNRERSTGGVLVATSSFTRGAIKEARENRQIELIDGVRLVLLLNEHLGARWPLRIEQICYKGLDSGRG